MDLRVASLRRFLYSHYFFTGVRQAVGMLLPVLLVAGLLDQYVLGLAATFGAFCVAIIDQPGPHWHRVNQMFGGSVLGTFTVLVTGLASSHPALAWLTVIALCFGFSMFSVFGRTGIQIGTACLLLMTLTMHEPLTPVESLVHAAATLGGGLFYLAFSLCASRLSGLREEQQALSMALYATAQYVSARAAFYDMTNDLDECYTRLIAAQSNMTDKHQAARDMVLRVLPRDGRRDPRRTMLWNIFVDMIGILDALVATHTDYAVLRRALPDSDLLMFARDALTKMALEIDRVALAVARGKPARHRTSVKAELRAIEYEIEQLRQQDYASREPEVYTLLIQILRRLRNTARIVERLYEHVQCRPDARPAGELRLDKSLTRFLSRQEFRLGMLTSNLRIDSPHCRYALRVTLAAALALAISHAAPALAPHNYWVLLTIIVIMKPGFAMTRQRNVLRLAGTLAGCALALGVFQLTREPAVLFAALVFACILGNSLVQVNYMASATFNTVFVLLAFHFISPSTLSVIGERALDTALGCAIALACSYVLPWWEARRMGPLARAAIAANREYLASGLRYVAACQAQARATGQPRGPDSPSDPAVQDADLHWRLARKNVHVAFSNLAEGFYRMMREPRSRQRNVPEINHLLIQNHILASQIAATIPLLAAMPETPPRVEQALKAVAALLASDADDTAAAFQFEPQGEEAAFAHPMKQMLQAAHMIRNEARALRAPQPLLGDSQPA